MPSNFNAGDYGGATGSDPSSMGYGGSSTAPVNSAPYQQKQSGDALQRYLDGLNDKQAQSQQWYENAMQRIQAFADEMAKYDPNDPLAKSLGQVAQSHAMMQAGASGLGGQGISQGNANQAVTNSQMAYQTQRSQMAQQAYGQLQSGALQASQQLASQKEFAQNFDFQKAQYNQGLATQAWQQQTANSPWTTATGLFAGYGGDKTFSAWTGGASGGLSSMGGGGGGGGGGGAGGGVGPWSNFGTSLGQMTGNLPAYKPTYYQGGGY